VLQIPPSASSREVVVHDHACTRARVEHPIVTHVDRHVIDSHALAGKQHQIARLQSVDPSGQGVPCGGLLARGTREIDAVAAEDILHEARAVETGGRGPAAVAIGGSHIAAGRGEDADGTRAGCSGKPRGRSVAGPPRCRTDGYPASTESGDYSNGTESGAYSNLR
jgi:hypothetical protein